MKNLLHNLETEVNQVEGLTATIDSAGILCVNTTEEYQWIEIHGDQIETVYIDETDGRFNVRPVGGAERFDVTSSEAVSHLQSLREKI